jgi:hypothetical protein
MHHLLPRYVCIICHVVVLHYTISTHLSSRSGRCCSGLMLTCAIPAPGISYTCVCCIVEEWSMCLSMREVTLSMLAAALSTLYH